MFVPALNPRMETILADQIHINCIAIGCQQRLDVDLILRPEGHHLGQDQPLGSGHADRVTFRPLHWLRVRRVRE